MVASGSSSEKIRILVVDDIADTRENIKKLLFFEDDLEIVGAASNGREGIELAATLAPDIVLMDINMPEMDGIAASEAISAKHPNVQIVMMSVQGESDYLRRSMLAGAREFLVKPFSGEDLVTSIRRVHQFAATRRALAPPPPAAVTAPPAQPGRGGKVIVVLGTKGGSGTTTIAVNLAIALREETKKQVAMIDANFEFGDVGVLMNLPSSRTIADLTGPNIEVDEEVLSGVMAGHTSGLKVLLAPMRPEMAELITPELLKVTLERLRGMFDYLLIDLWKSFQESSIHLLDEADQILLVATSELPAIKNAKLFFELADALGYPPEKMLFILNKEDGRSGISVKDIQASIRHPIRAILPRDERTTTYAINRGTPFIMTHRNSVLSQSIIALARALQRSAEKEAASATKAKAARAR